MIRLRRVHALVLAVPALLVACGSGDVLDGRGTSGSQSADFPSSSASSAPTDSSASAPTSAGASGRSVVDLRSLTGTSTSIGLDPAFISALTTLKITPGLVGTARLAGSSLVLPVTGGNITVFAPGAPQVASGSVDHAGSGLTLTSGGTTISLTEFRVDLGDAPQVNGTVLANGKVVVRSVTLFDVDDESVRATGSTGTASVSGLSLRTDSGLAGLLNKSFGTAAFTSGLLLGTATLALTGS